MEVLLAVAQKELEKELTANLSDNTDYGTVKHCESPDELLAQLQPEKPVLILLDQNFMAQGSTPLPPQIKALQWNSYIIVLAYGNNEGEELSSFLEQGADDLLICPATSGEIKARLFKARRKLSNSASVDKNNNNLSEVKQALQKERDFFSAINDIMGSLVVVLDRGGRITRLNRACQDLTGYAFAEVENNYFWDVFLEEEERELAKTFFLSLQPEHFPYEMESTWLMKDGSIRQILCSNTYVPDQNGAISYYISTGIDVTERNNVEKSLREANEKFRALIHASPVAVISLNLEGKVTSWSSAAEKIFGWAEREVLGQSLPIVTDEINDCLNTLFGDVNFGKSFNSKEIQCYRKDNTPIYASLSAAPLRSYTGSVNGILIIADDITLRQQNEEQLRYLSFHDSLTGLYNRAYFEEELKRLNTVRQLPLSIIIGDVNGLKLVNDTFGHGEGDKYLLGIVQVLKDSCRKEDVICRWGGDEFAVLLPNTGGEVVSKICRRIQAACSETGGHLIPLSISLGAITKEDESQDIQEMLKKAEDRMYRNKLVDSRRASTSVISALQKALAENTNETEEHALRLQSYALKLGYALELSFDELDDLTILCALHDIGMIALPAEITNKEGVFTPEEREIMKQHSETGYRIAKTVPHLTYIADKILAHHERWDGRGYPNGLKGVDIPLVSRIFTLVDAYEAMTAGRPYRKARNSAVALEELQINAGSQFDPALVKIFVEIMK